MKKMFLFGVGLAALNSVSAYAGSMGAQATNLIIPKGL